MKHIFTFIPVLTILLTGGLNVTSVEAVERQSVTVEQVDEIPGTNPIIQLPIELVPLRPAATSAPVAVTPTQIVFGQIQDSDFSVTGTEVAANDKQLPDLIVQAFSVSTNTPAHDEEIFIQFSVANMGSAPVTKPVFVSVTADGENWEAPLVTNGTLNSGTSIHYRGDDVKVIGFGDGKPFTLTLKVETRMSELSRSNNTSSITITPKAIPTPTPLPIQPTPEPVLQPTPSPVAHPMPHPTPQITPSPVTVFPPLGDDITEWHLQPPARQDFTDGKTFMFTSGQPNNNTLTITDNTDLYFTGHIARAINNINLINKDGEVAASIEILWANEYSVMRNLPAGEYTLEIDSVDNISTVPYMVSVTAVPAKPELTLPQRLDGVRTAQVRNVYANNLVVEINGKPRTIPPFTTSSLVFDEGTNFVRYYSQNADGMSGVTNRAIVRDTTAPSITITSAMLDGNLLQVIGQISEYSDALYVNGEKITLGEFLLEGQPIAFGYTTDDTDMSELEIEATDSSGNRTELIVELN